MELNKKGLGYCDCTYKRVHWTLKKLKQAGKDRGYELLGNPRKIDTSQIYSWKCKEKGHVTHFAIGLLRSGCNKCFQENRYTSLKDVRSWLLVNAPGIKLLKSQKWNGSNTVYSFKCQICQTIFTKDLHNMFKYPKCKNTSRSYSELLVQFYLETILDVKFVANKKYDFLRNSSGNKMELDGYNGDLKIAFEHQGVQHYTNSIWHSTDIAVKKRINDDNLKKSQCESNNVKLIVIPALFEITPLNELKNVIKSECTRLGICLPANFDSIKPDTSKMIVYHKKKKV